MTLLGNVELRKGIGNMRVISVVVISVFRYLMDAFTLTVNVSLNFRILSYQFGIVYFQFLIYLILYPGNLGSKNSIKYRSRSY